MTDSRSLAHFGEILSDFQFLSFARLPVPQSDALSNSSKCLRIDFDGISNWYFWGRPVIGWRSLTHYVIGWERYLVRINLKTLLSGTRTFEIRGWRIISSRKTSFDSSSGNFLLRILTGIFWTTGAIPELRFDRLGLEFRVTWLSSDFSCFTAPLASIHISADSKFWFSLSSVLSFVFTTSVNGASSSKLIFSFD